VLLARTVTPEPMRPGAVGEGVQLGQLAGEHRGDPLRQPGSAQLVHHVGEVADVIGERVEGGAALADGVEPVLVGWLEFRRVGHDPFSGAAGFGS
jgi:hypothetical protein